MEKLDFDYRYRPSTPSKRHMYEAITSSDNTITLTVEKIWSTDYIFRVGIKVNGVVEWAGRFINDLPNRDGPHSLESLTDYGLEKAQRVYQEWLEHQQTMPSLTERRS